MATDAPGTQDLAEIFGMPGHLLRRCQQIAVAIFMQDCADFDLTPLQFILLVTLEEGGPQDQATISGRAALDRTTTAGVIKNLEDRGLATRTVSPEDRRAKIVEITPAGREVVTAVRPRVAQVQNRILAPLTAKEQDQLVRLLTKVADGNNTLSRAPYIDRGAGDRKRKTG